MKVPTVQPAEPSMTPDPATIAPANGSQAVPPQQPIVPSEDSNSQEMPFGKEKFDAGIDVDEDADPKKYIEKLTGKLAQKLRDFNGTESDTDLNKFVINSLIPAAIPQMDDSDAQDVIKKINDNNSQNTEQGGEENAEPDTTQFDQQADDNSGNNFSRNPQESKDNEIDDLISEILGTRKTKSQGGRKNPFKGPKFK